MAEEIKKLSNRASITENGITTRGKYIKLIRLEYLVRLKVASVSAITKNVQGTSPQYAYTGYGMVPESICSISVLLIKVKMSIDINAGKTAHAIPR
jgi:hypothetical protein